MKPPFSLKPGCSENPNPQLEIYANGLRALELGELVHQTMQQPVNYTKHNEPPVSIEQLANLGHLVRSNAGVGCTAIDLFGFKVLLSEALPPDTMVVGKEVFRMLGGGESK